MRTSAGVVGLAVVLWTAPVCRPDITFPGRGAGAMDISEDGRRLIGVSQSLLSGQLSIQAWGIAGAEELAETPFPGQHIDALKEIGPDLGYWALGDGIWKVGDGAAIRIAAQQISAGCAIGDKLLAIEMSESLFEPFRAILVDPLGNMATPEGMPLVDVGSKLVCADEEIVISSGSGLFWGKLGSLEPVTMNPTVDDLLITSLGGRPEEWVAAFGTLFAEGGRSTWRNARLEKVQSRLWTLFRSARGWP